MSWYKQNTHYSFFDLLKVIILINHCKFVTKKYINQFEYFEPYSNFTETVISKLLDISALFVKAVCKVSRRESPDSEMVYRGREPSDTSDL